MSDIDTDAKQRTVDTFNANHLPGAWVRYWTGTRQDPSKYGQTRSRAELLSGHTPVVWVTTHGACIALTHVDPIPGQPDDVEWDSHDLPKLAGATERVGDYIAANGDGIYDVLDGHPLYARDLEALRQAAGHVWIGEQLRDEVEQLRAALAQSRAQAATYANEIGSLKAELEHLREQVFAQKPVVEAAEAWAEMVEIGGDAPGDARKVEDALHDAIEQHRLMDAALTSARAEHAEATR